MIDIFYLAGFLFGLWIFYKIISFIIKKVRKSPTTETKK